MKIKDLQTAMRLATITKRPLEDFYDGPTESQNIEQTEEEHVEANEEVSSEEIESDVQEVQDVAPVRLREVHANVPVALTDEARKLIENYGGRMSENGKLICGRDITRKEYLALIKDMTQQDVLNSPLLYVLFRAEGQTEGHFVQWLSGFPEEV